MGFPPEHSHSSRNPATPVQSHPSYSSYGPRLTPGISHALFREKPPSLQSIEWRVQRGGLFLPGTDNLRVHSRQVIVDSVLLVGLGSLYLEMIGSMKLYHPRRRGWSALQPQSANLSRTFSSIHCRSCCSRAPQPSTVYPEDAQQPAKTNCKPSIQLNDPRA